VTALEPWPDTVQWRRVSPKLITVELISRGTLTVVVLIGLLIGQLFAPHPLWYAGMALVVLLGIWRAIVTVRAVKAWGYADGQRPAGRHGLLIRRCPSSRTPGCSTWT
jgi:F0F1-type ATP synthase assembly protein I